MQIQANPALQLQLAPVMETARKKMGTLKSHSELHLRRKADRETLEKGPRTSAPAVGAPEARRPPLLGNLSGGAVKMNGGAP